jgi:glycosyltransferase involved in cell wall biosynthesis
LEIYHRLAEHLPEVTLLTYGGESEWQYSSSLGKLGLLPARWYSRQQITALLIALRFFPQLLSSDVFKTNQIRGALIPIWLKKIFRKKLIVRCGFLHGFFTKQYTDDPRRIQDAIMLEKTAFKNADIGVVTSEWQKKLIVGDYELDADKIRVIPNYVVTDRFKPDPFTRKKYDLIFVGRSHRQKNLTNLIAALQQLKQMGKSFSLRLVGGCCNDDGLRQQAAGLDVTYTGNLSSDELPVALNESMVFILPSHYEGHPKALLEAMSCGLACIGTDVIGIRDNISHLHNGYLCKSDTESLAMAIKEVCSSEKLRKVLGDRARKHAVENYDIDRIVELELDVLKSIYY